MTIRRWELRRCIVAASALIGLLGAALAQGAATTVYGTGTHPSDMDAVQAALDDSAYDTVILSGTFDFGLDGGVQITRPNVTLKGPATILGGGKQIEHPWVWWWWYTVEVAAVGTTVEDLAFEGAGDAAILVHLAGTGDGHINITGNSVNGCWAGVAPLPAAEPTEDNVSIDIHDNTINNCVFGVFAQPLAPFTYAMSIRNNVIANTYEDGVRMWWISAPLDIIDNEFANAGWEAIWVSSWYLGGQIDPEFGDNPPVNIIGNTIELTDYATGIMVGTSAGGINNVLVQNNVLKGIAGYGGLMKQPYGHNNRFIGNDLSEMMSYGPQILFVGGRDNLFFNNKLGPTMEWDIPWLAGGIVEETAAILSATANWHLNDQATPDPVNHGNVFIANDFRATGLPGWDDAHPDHAGSVLLLDFIQKYTVDWVPFEDPFTTENTVIELGKFPTVDGEKTRVCTQVRDMSNLYPDDMVPGTNRVAGWRHCEKMAMDEEFD